MGKSNGSVGTLLRMEDYGHLKKPSGSAVEAGHARTMLSAAIRRSGIEAGFRLHRSELVLELYGVPTDFNYSLFGAVSAIVVKSMGGPHRYAVSYSDHQPVRGVAGREDVIFSFSERSVVHGMYDRGNVIELRCQKLGSEHSIGCVDIIHIPQYCSDDPRGA